MSKLEPTILFVVVFAEHVCSNGVSDGAELLVEVVLLLVEICRRSFLALLIISLAKGTHSGLARRISLRSRSSMNTEKPWDLLAGWPAHPLLDARALSNASAQIRSGLSRRRPTKSPSRKDPTRPPSPLPSLPYCVTLASCSGAYPKDPMPAARDGS